MLDRLVIGTANWGRDYNGHNVSEKEQDLIMEYMKEVGIEWLDVATAYGTEFIGMGEFPRIIKVNKPLTFSTNHVDDIQIGHHKCIVDGLSVDKVTEIPIGIDLPKWVEFPYSIMNRSKAVLILAGFTKLIARSIFCKGKALKYFSPQECIDFVLMNPRINKVIIGVDSVDQLKENVAHLVKMEKFEYNEEVDTRKFLEKVMNWNRTLSLIPDGVQTLSKMPNKYVDGVYPKYISHGKGSKVYAEGKEYIDYTCGLGAILLGHANEDVNQAVFEQARKGNLFGLPNESETLLAEKIVEHFPVDKVRFIKTGSEATSAAIKIARAYTNKETILCCGYHGWHEWYNATTPKNKGSVKGKVYPFKYNDISSLRALFRRHSKVAAVIMEPYVYDAPENNFLEEVRRACSQNNALFILDEVVTGFRTNRWCAANEFKVIPDLMCLGKAMGNGYAISAVAGKADVMDVLKGDCFVSSTFGGELTSIAAALKVFDLIEKRGVFTHLQHMGDRVKTNFNIIAGNEGIKAECIGYGCRTHFKFDDPVEKSVFWQECFKKGVFFGHAQFTGFAHDLGDADNTIVAMRHALRMLRKYVGHVRDLLEIDAAEETQRLVS